MGGAGAGVAEGTTAGRPAGWPRRQLIGGIRFRVRTGVPLRDVPPEYGPWGRIYDLFRRWQRNGTWHRVFSRLQSLADAKGAITWDVSVDSTVWRAHQCVLPIRSGCDATACSGSRRRRCPRVSYDQPASNRRVSPRTL
ncbi:transposase [Streptomyces sp. NPDC059814]|uniref:transposase n=1 Tax=Streptomyces sp. NPDC059814 TaxID=3346959 RepID=UPI0036539EFA